MAVRTTCWLIFVLAISRQAFGEVDFDREVRPILSDMCFQCHGPDEDARKAELRLDIKASALREAFVPGKVEKSEAIRRIFSDNADERMPPVESKLALSAAQKATLRKWVMEGADWTEHWAFRPPAKAEPPADDSGWARNAIDQFVLARMKMAGLSPSLEAGRGTLIRRLTLDLTGIPPTPEEVAEFVSDSADNAYEKVVDRLLSSPKYGERMAWEWLDAARYADTDGFQGDPTRTMWPWRDWLIRALNDNMPFDQFTIEMLAGDLLPNAVASQVVATGFNRNHMHNGEGGRIAEETRVENVFDRAETTATVWLGLTMTCCRCHDHKFDPITQQEYYRLFAFFNNTSESGSRGGGKAPPILNYVAASTREQIAELDEEIRNMQLVLDGPQAELDAEQAEWEVKQLTKLKRLGDKPLKVSMSPWQAIGPLRLPAGAKVKLFRYEFGPEKSVDLAVPVAGSSWREEKGYVDGKVHPLSSTVGSTYLFRKLEASAECVLDISLGSDDGIVLWLNGQQQLAKDVARGAAANQESARLVLKAGSNQLLMKIVNTGGIGGFYFRQKSATFGGLPPEVVASLRVDSGKRNEKQRSTVRRFFRERNWKDWKEHSKKLQENKTRRGQLAKRSVPVMVMDDLPANRRRVTKILSRGGYDKPGEEVSEGTPSRLHPLPEQERYDRLSLAKWLVSAENPLSARVTVNRYWQTFFGRGIVATTEDFGSQGARPTHPQLLDWLAVKFMESDWNVKAIHKLIVMSASYQQHAAVTAKVMQLDPENLWLSRSPRYRLPSWMLRDQVLAVSGLLNEKIGGPSVRPYQPAGIWAEATFNKIRYSQDKGESLYRRSVYVFWRRIVGPTMFFDSGKRQTCEVKPTRTNTPLHALTTLNETTFVEAARALAQRTLRHEVAAGASKDEARVDWVFRAVTSRSPGPNEVKLLTARWRALREHFAKNRDEAVKLLAVGDSARDEQLDVVEHAACTVVCSILLNLDETLSRE